MTDAGLVSATPRFATVRSPERKTLGTATARVAKLLGINLMPWQRDVLDVALELEGDRLVYGDVGITIGRQQGKSTLLLALWIARCVLWPSQTVVYTAQSGQDARKKWAEDWLPVLQGSPLGAFVRVRQQNGSESVSFQNGSRQSIVAGTVKSGHGTTLDLVILDEIFAFQDARLEQALRPATITRPSPQFWVCSTAGTPHGSPYLLDKVERGRQAVEAGLDRSLAYFEYSAPDDAPVDDPETWRQCMPALGFTVSEDTVRASLESMARREFERAFLNRWVASIGEPAVDLDLWEELADPDAERPSDVVLAVDVAPGSVSASIAAAGERDGVLLVTVLESGPGTDWVVPGLEALCEQLHPAEVIADQRAAAPLLSGFRGAPVTATSAADMATGCLFLLDLVKNKRLRHRGERELAVAIDGASRRSLGDGFAWSRKNSGVDITPLVAVTLAAWAFHGSMGDRS
jgi:phage terminase large subunit-like protein